MFECNSYEAVSHIVARTSIGFAVRATKHKTACCRALPMRMQIQFGIVCLINKTFLKFLYRKAGSIEVSESVHCI